MSLSDDDTNLVERLLDGDERAFETLIDHHYSAMLRLAKTFVADESTAEEVVQETWTAVIDGLDRFEGRSSLKTWIFSILTNLARKRSRRDSRETVWSSISEEPLDGEASEMTERFDSGGRWNLPPKNWKSDPEQELMRSRMLDEVQKALDDLPARQRAVVMLRDVEGLTPEEACDVLEITRGNQRVLLHRGRTKIREALEESLSEGGESR